MDLGNALGLGNKFLVVIEHDVHGCGSIIGGVNIPACELNIDGTTAFVLCIVLYFIA